MRQAPLGAGLGVKYVAELKARCAPYLSLESNSGLLSAAL